MTPFPPAPTPAVSGREPLAPRRYAGSMRSHRRRESWPSTSLIHLGDGNQVVGWGWSRTSGTQFRNLDSRRNLGQSARADHLHVMAQAGAGGAEEVDAVADRLA